MYLLVDIERIVVSQVLQHHAGDIFLKAVAPLYEKRVALKTCGAGGVSIAGKRKLVSITAEPGVGDFSRTLVGRLCGEGEAKKQNAEE